MKYETPYDRPTRKAAETASAEMGETEKGGGEEKMSAIIKGFEVPNRCADCFLRGGLWCYALEPEEKRVSKTGKREDCPLVPLPKGHGRLIDAERFRVILCRLKERQNDDVAIHAVNWAIECLDKLDTIIPAEGGGEE